MGLYYYNTKILLPVSGRRLVYKFGPSARGWSSHEPILYAGYSSTAYSSDEEEVTSGENMSTYSSFDVEYPIKYRELPSEKGQWNLCMDHEINFGKILPDVEKAAQLGPVIG
ncbi:hypothetical protein ANCDUO_03053 [Ancylostoma duodenale]|uniref:ETS domain-containing protein n=1 Tax=Ancylostoma duodenale TaxID=51022 RepID=A0A0C2GYP3_9BILA|nr:hypothetical protein ANCDUO_03053 [Ancylostoma duodenale]